MNNYILVVEDQPECRQWMSLMLHEVFPQCVLLEADSVSSAKNAIAKIDFYFVLVDLGLPDGSGISIIQDVAQKRSQTHVIVLSIYDDAEHIFPAIKAGAQGYLLKDQSEQIIQKKLKGMINGDPPLSPSIARKMLDYFSGLQDGQTTAGEQLHLTPREEDILVLVARGLSRKEIAETLHLKVHTVAFYIKELYKKIGVNTRAEAAVLACQMGLIKVV